MSSFKRARSNSSDTSDNQKMLVVDALNLLMSSFNSSTTNQQNSSSIQINSYTIRTSSSSCNPVIDLSGDDDILCKDIEPVAATVPTTSPFFSSGNTSPMPLFFTSETAPTTSFFRRAVTTPPTPCFSSFTARPTPCFSSATLPTSCFSTFAAQHAQFSSAALPQPITVAAAAAVATEPIEIINLSTLALEGIKKLKKNARNTLYSVINYWISLDTSDGRLRTKNMLLKYLSERNYFSEDIDKTQLSNLTKMLNTIIELISISMESKYRYGYEQKLKISDEIIINININNVNVFKNLKNSFHGMIIDCIKSGKFED